MKRNPRRHPPSSGSAGSASGPLAVVARLQKQIVEAGSDEDRVMDLVARQAMEVTGADGSVIELQEGDEMVYRAVAGTASPHLGLRLGLRSSLSGRATLEGRAMVSDDTEEDPRVDREASRKIGVRSMVIVPLQTESRTLGVLKVLASEPSRFAEEDLELLSVLAGLMSVSIIAAQEAGSRRVLTRHLQALFEAAPDAIFVVDLEQRVTLWSPSAEKLYGWSAGEVVGRRPPMIPTTRMEGFSAALRTVTSGENVAGVETVHETRHGSELQVSLSGAPKRDTDGQVVGAAFFARDIRDEKALQARIMGSQRLEAIGRLAGGIAHDFNNMLTAISGFGRLLLDDSALPKPHRSHVEEILRAASRSAYITQQLLAYSGRQVLQSRSIDVNAVVNQMKTVVHHLLGNGIRLETDLDGGPCFVKVDEGQLEQVFLNLIANARDAIVPRPGLVRIETKLMPAERVDAELGFSQGRLVRLSIRDDGAGMSEEVASRVFEPFFTTKGLSEGTGLGLATVEGIVHQSGGRITVDSTPGRGTTFEIYLPALEEEAVSPGATRSSQGVRDPLPRTILLVEDEDAIRRLLERVLERYGHQVLPADLPSTAMEIMSRRGAEIDLLVSDVVMPEMTGHDLLAALRKEWPDLPCLFISGYVEDEVARHGSMDRTAFLGKPFEPRELVEALEKLPLSRRDLVQ